MSTNTATIERGSENVQPTKVHSQIDKLKKEDKSTKGRPALGLLNQNTARVQPFRAAKQNATVKGFFSSQHCALEYVKSPATHLKKSLKKETTKNEQNTENIPAIPSSSQVHTALTSLPNPTPLLRKHSLLDISMHSAADSSMMLDCSEEERLNIFDIDANAGIYGLSEYATEIFAHLREIESQYRPKANYMRKQQDINVSMRSIVVDWLVEVSEEYKLLTETLHLAVNYVDRFLSSMAVLRGKLQLVGATAMFLAAKFEEIYPPDVDEFVYITDDTYTKKQVLRMEHLMLRVLNFDVAIPTSNQFLNRFLKAADADDKTKFLSQVSILLFAAGKLPEVDLARTSGPWDSVILRYFHSMLPQICFQYLCELALLRFEFVSLLPSKIAASAVCLASYTLSRKLWNQSMEFYTKYKLHELKPCILFLRNLLEGAETNPQQTIYKKYKAERYNCVAELKAPSTIPFPEADSHCDAETCSEKN